MSARGVLLLALLAATAPGAAVGQERDSGHATLAVRSFVVPGWGQIAMDQRRGWAYLGAEALAWSMLFHWRSEGHELRAIYRDLAWETARAGAGGERIDPDFSYFERLAHWRRSGAWDASAALAGIQPEGDPSTYNGMIWVRARDLFLGGERGAGASAAGYASALAYYEERAYGPALLWRWEEDADMEHFRDLIDRSDSRLQNATHALGAVLVNHLLSGVDAWVSSRSGAHVRSRLTLPALPGRAGWLWTVRLTR